jgi:hypothetical protein
MLPMADGRSAIRRRSRFISAASPAPILSRAFRIARSTGCALTTVPYKATRIVRRKAGRDGAHRLSPAMPTTVQRLFQVAAARRVRT